MRIYPAIDIKNGKCVRLKQGRFDEVTTYFDNPVEVAIKWKDMGAKYLHIVDLDGALAGESINADVIRKIVEVTGLPVQTGGGIRTIKDIEDKIATGVSRIIIGTAAVKNPPLVELAVQKYGDKIAVGIDAKNGMVAVQGWEEVSTVSDIDMCKKMKKYGVKTIIYTDISKDGMLSGPNIDATKRLIDEVGIDVIGSGGVASMKDLDDFNGIGVEGVIVGKALYSNKINLSQAINKFE